MDVKPITGNALVTRRHKQPSGIKSSPDSVNPDGDNGVLACSSKYSFLGTWLGHPQRFLQRPGPACHLTEVKTGSIDRIFHRPRVVGGLLSPLLLGSNQSGGDRTL